MAVAIQPSQAKQRQFKRANNSDDVGKPNSRIADGLAISSKLNRFFENALKHRRSHLNGCEACISYIYIYVSIHYLYIHINIGMYIKYILLCL